jgi:hypothetical protein
VDGVGSGVCGVAFMTKRLTDLPGRPFTGRG